MAKLVLKQSVKAHGPLVQLITTESGESVEEVCWFIKTKCNRKCNRIYDYMGYVIEYDYDYKS